MTLLQRGKFLERERVHPAELRHFAFGAGKSCLLLAAHVGCAGGWLGFVAGVGVCVGARVRACAVQGRGGGCPGVYSFTGDQHRGPILGHKDLFHESELGAGPLEECGEVQFLFVDLHLEPVHGLADSMEAVAQVGFRPA